MVEVIAKGKTARDPNITATCGSCNARLCFRKSEARFEADQRDGDVYVIRCPVCRRDVWIAASVVDKR